MAYPSLGCEVINPREGTVQYAEWVISCKELSCSLPGVYWILCQVQYTLYREFTGCCAGYSIHYRGCLLDTLPGTVRDPENGTRGT